MSGHEVVFLEHLHGVPAVRAACLYEQGHFVIPDSALHKHISHAALSGRAGVMPFAGEFTGRWDSSSPRGIYEPHSASSLETPPQEDVTPSPDRTL